jgi:hypothetical protein
LPGVGDILGKKLSDFRAKFAAQIQGIREQNDVINPRAESKQSAHDTDSAARSRIAFDFFTMASIRFSSRLSSLRPLPVRP